MKDNYIYGQCLACGIKLSQCYLRGGYILCYDCQEITRKGYENILEHEEMG